MREFSWFEKILVSMCLAAIMCSVYYLGFGQERVDIRQEMPVGILNLAKGDTRWKAATQARHFKTWDKQKLYVGDSLYVGAASRLGFRLGAIQFDLLPRTRVSVQMDDGAHRLEAGYGQFEMHLPPGERMRVSVESKYLDLSSVNGGRVSVQIEADRTIRVRNLAGDLVVRTEGRTEYTVPEEEIFRAKN